MLCVFREANEEQQSRSHNMCEHRTSNITVITHNVSCVMKLALSLISPHSSFVGIFCDF